MRPLLRAIPFLLVATTGVVLARPAQQQDPAKIPGFVRALQDDTGSGQEIGPNRMPTAAEVKSMRAQLLAIFEVVKKTPYFAHPVGFTTQPRIGLGDASRYAWRGSRLWPLTGTVIVGSFLNFIDQAGKLRVVDAAGPIRGDDRPSHELALVINSLGCVFGGDALFTDATGPIFVKGGDAEKNDRGFPVYRDCVIVTQRKEPLVVPVTKERVLQIYIGDAAAALKEIETMAAAVPAARRSEYAAPVAERKATLDKYRAMLAALTPAERAAPAVISMNPQTIFAGAGDSAYPLIEPNPKFFDMARLDQIQIIAVRTGLSDKEREFLPQVDWAGLLALAK